MGLTIGPLHVRRSVFIEATPARVWEEFANFERIRAWLGKGHALHTLDPRVGGLAHLSVEVRGEARHFGGTVLVFEPGQELSFESNWHAPYAWPVATFWTIRLTPMSDGTQVELFHHGFERLGAEAADELQGWDVKHLVALRAIVEKGGTEPEQGVAAS